jgi:PEP-CTERM motif
MTRIFKIVAFATLLLTWTTNSAHADSFDVSLKTSSLVGLGPQILLFEFIDGDGSIDNSLTLSDFNFATGAAVGAADYSGTTGVSGDLTSGIAMNDSGGLAIFDQEFNAGASLSFQLSTTNNFAGVAPDEFSMFVCDLSFDCYSDDMVAGNLLGLGLTGGTLSPSSFTLNGAMGQGLPTPVVTEVTATTPEPASILLLGLGLALLGLMNRMRSSGGTGKQHLLA